MTNNKVLTQQYTQVSYFLRLMKFPDFQVIFLFFLQGLWSLKNANYTHVLLQMGLQYQDKTMETTEVY